MIDKKDLEALIQEKYGGDRSADLSSDIARLEQGEPLAYVIGHIPFLGLSIDLSSRPLIPRPETEWWTEEVITSLSPSQNVLDLCAGSGAIGLALIKHVPGINVSFGEIQKEHVKQIKKNAKLNGLGEVDARESDLFSSFKGEQFAVIVTNPPYIPTARSLEKSVSEFEPGEALYGGEDGLSIIKRILTEAPEHVLPSGVVYMECDIENIEEAQLLAQEHGAVRTEILTDPYGRPRLLVAYY